MTHEQMVAWLILEGWEYHPKKASTICHLARNMVEEPYVRRGELCLLGTNAARYLRSGTSSASVDDYDPSLAGASEKEIQLFYNALQEGSHDT